MVAWELAKRHNDERTQVESIAAATFIAAIFAAGYWIGAMRTKLKFAANLDMRKWQKQMKALDEAVQKAQMIHATK